MLGAAENASAYQSVDAFSKLADIMTAGFKGLQNILLNQMEEEENFKEAAGKNQDFFTDLADELDSGNSTGPDVRKSLADLSDKLLRLKVNDSVMKEKRETYLRPKNIEFLQVPKVNKPIWENLSTSTLPRKINESLTVSINSLASREAI